ALEFLEAIRHGAPNLLARRTSHDRNPSEGSDNPPVHRFFAPALDVGDESVTLPRSEGEHLTRVLRLGVGDEVAVFDGRGHEFLARVVSALRRHLRVPRLPRLPSAAAPAAPLPP